MITRFLSYAVTVAVAAAVVGCAGQEKAAQEAVTAAEQGVEALRADGEAVMPAEFQPLAQHLAQAKAQLNERLFDSALATAQAVSTHASELQSALPAKREALIQSWVALAEGVPPLLAAVESQLAGLAKARRLPSGVTKQDVAAAQAAVDSLKQDWNAAEEAQQSGKLSDAVARATAVETKAGEIAAKLKLRMPAGTTE